MSSKTISTLNILSFKASHLHSTAQVQNDSIIAANTIASARPQRKATQAHSPQTHDTPPGTSERATTAYTYAPSTAILDESYVCEPE